MSELVPVSGETVSLRRALLVTTSVAIMACYDARDAKTNDDVRPTVWLELGGQAEILSGTTSAFTAPFVFIQPEPNVYDGASFVSSQRPSHFSFGAEGKLTFEPNGSDWLFSASIRYGRSNSHRHIHNQIKHSTVPVEFTYSGRPYHYEYTPIADSLADSNAQLSESHVIVDFTAGKDVGL